MRSVQLNTKGIQKKHAFHLRFLISSMPAFRPTWHLQLLAVFFWILLFRTIVRFVKCLMMPACWHLKCHFERRNPLILAYQIKQRNQNKEKKWNFWFLKVFARFLFSFFLYVVKFAKIWNTIYWNTHNLFFTDSILTVTRKTRISTLWDF